MVAQSQFIEMFGGSDYPKHPLGNLCKILAGKTLPLDVENEGGPIAYIKVADMNLPENDRVVTTSTRNVTEETAIISGILPIGATVFPKNGAAALHNKKRITAITTCVDMNTMGVYSTSDALDPEFLYAFLVHQDVASLTLTGAIPQIRPKDIAALEIPLPPLERQRGYIGMVGQADKSKFDGLKSQFIEETKRWENEGTIRDLIHNTVEKAGKKYSADSKIRYIDISSVDNETNTVTGVTEYIFKDAPSRAQQCVKKGDILVSTVRPNLKNIAVNHLDGEDLVASSGFCVLRPKEGCAGLILAYILSDVFTEKMTLVAKGTNYPAIHDSDILDYKIRLSEDGKVSMIDRLFKQADKSKYLS